MENNNTTKNGAAPKSAADNPQFKEFIRGCRESGLYRSEDRLITGVCSGLAERFGWKKNVVRLAFVVLAFFGIGLMVYGALTLLTPFEKDDLIPVEQIVKKDVTGDFLLGCLAVALPLLGIFGGGPRFGGIFHLLAFVFWSVIGVAIVSIILIVMLANKSGHTETLKLSAANMAVDMADKVAEKATKLADKANAKVEKSAEKASAKIDKTAEKAQEKLNLTAEMSEDVLTKMAEDIEAKYAEKYSEEKYIEKMAKLNEKYNKPQRPKISSFARRTFLGLFLISLAPVALYDFTRDQYGSGNMMLNQMPVHSMFIVAWTVIAAVVVLINSLRGKKSGLVFGMMIAGLFISLAIATGMHYGMKMFGYNEYPLNEIKAYSAAEVEHKTKCNALYLTHDSLVKVFDATPWDDDREKEMNELEQKMNDEGCYNYSVYKYHKLEGHSNN